MSRRLDAVYPSRDEASVGTGEMSRTTLSEGQPRRFRDTNDRPASADRTCGAPSSALQRSSIVVSGWGCTAGRASASSHNRSRAPASTTESRAAASSEPLGPGVRE